VGALWPGKGRVKGLHLMVAAIEVQAVAVTEVGHVM
jgi:hypothetical protein